jgi:hypothetical protein
MFDLNFTVSGDHVITVGGSKILSASATIEFIWWFCRNYSVTLYANIFAAKIFGGQALKVSFRGE